MKKNNFDKYFMSILLLVCGILSGLFKRGDFFAGLAIVNLFFCFKLYRTKSLCLNRYSVFILLQLIFSIIQAFVLTNKYELVYTICLWWLIFVFSMLSYEWFKVRAIELDLYYSTLFVLGVLLAVVNIVKGVLSTKFTLGTFYVNSLAGVLFVTFLCGLHILKDADKKQLKYAYIKLGLILIGIAFLLTNSRIMYAIGLLVCLFYLVKKGYKQNYISKKMITILIRTLIFIGITVSVGMIFSKELRDTGGKLVFRVSELNERFAYYHDSVGIVQDNPAIGLGAGGWASRQSEYQSSLYSTRYNHSSIMQALVDGGFIGIILFLLIFIWPNVKGFLIYKKTGSRDISFPLLINLIMFAHSLLDFDFSIPIFMIIFIMNNILILTKCELLEQKKPRQEVSKVNNLSKFLLKKVLLFLTIIIAVVAILCGIAGGLSEHFFDKGVIAYNKQLYQEAIDNMEVSVKLNPFHTEAHYLMSYAYKNITNENSISNGINSYYMNGQKHINKAQLLDKYNPKYFLARGNLYFGAGDYENSTKEYEQLVRYQPLIWYNYELLTMSLEAEIKSLEGPSESSKERIRIATDKLEGIPFLIEKAKEKYSFWTFRVKHKPE